MTFEPHPRSFFRPLDPVFRLTPPALKRALASLHGVGAYVEVPFDADMAQVSAESFIADLLIDRLDVRGVVVGTDFHFGRGRAGTAAVLRHRLAEAGRLCHILPPVLDADGVAVSSTRVREALAEGDVGRANALLGHAFTVRAEVVHGDKRGRLLGYPTANMRLPPETRLRHGIYAVRFTAGDGVTRPAVASFGRRPTFDDGAPRLETFVFDFAGDLYGQTCEVAFHGFLRPEARFEDVPALIAQMDRDSAAARALLAEG
jgi:riboflavin kinase/FMN adenylyltransferase